VIIYPYRKAGYPAQDNVIIGNTAFYGAITGEAYIRGAAGERFCIRNSGLSAVVEAVGDHGCEYMTGGRVAVLGKTGRNFAAGMSGGIAYVYNPLGDFPQKCNLEMVELEQLGAEDRQALKALLQNHCRYTASVVARRMLDNFAVEAGNFLKVMPREYKRILEQRGAAEIAELLEVSNG
jgi:glutamate synthase domain-containing protein 3